MYFLRETVIEKLKLARKSSIECDNIKTNKPFCNRRKSVSLNVPKHRKLFHHVKMKRLLKTFVKTYLDDKDMF